MLNHSHIADPLKETHPYIVKQEKKEDGNNKTKLITQNVTVSSINNIILNFLICINSYTIKPKREQ